MDKQPVRMDLDFCEEVIPQLGKMLCSQDLECVEAAITILENHDMFSRLDTKHAVIVLGLINDQLRPSYATTFSSLCKKVSAGDIFSRYALRSALWSYSHHCTPVAVSNQPKSCFRSNKVCVTPKI